MANSDHIKWLLEGVESWNARRAQTDFEPDFEGANIYESFQNSVRLNEEGYIPLAGINLRRANFHKARLSSQFQTVGADLRNAALWCADLREVEMKKFKARRRPVLLAPDSTMQICMPPVSVVPRWRVLGFLKRIFPMPISQIRNSTTHISGTLTFLMQSS